MKFLKNNKGFTTVRLLIPLMTIMIFFGSAIAVKDTGIYSITKGLYDAKMATNMANARSAYTMVTTEIPFSEHLEKTSYTYDTVTGEIKEDIPAYDIKDANTEISGKDKIDISNWKSFKNIKSNEKSLYEDTAKKWRVFIENGKVVGYLAIWE